jgi:hypothetical protein
MRDSQVVPSSPKTVVEQEGGGPGSPGSSRISGDPGDALLAASSSAMRWPLRRNQRDVYLEQ